MRQVQGWRAGRPPGYLELADLVPSGRLLHGKATGPAFPPPEVVASMLLEGTPVCVDTRYACLSSCRRSQPSLKAQITGVTPRPPIIKGSKVLISLKGLNNVM